ncbi:hypothetical protein [Micrococcus luteus]|uniref:hypothetical protein n=2 Tax=Micrococcus luteus TaxID=1270 RepID=UPI003440143A
MIRGLRAWRQARARRRAGRQRWACRMLDAALVDAWPGHGLSAAVPVDGWACSRGTLGSGSGSSLEVRLSGGGMVDVVVDGDVVDSDFPSDCWSGDTTLQAALAESLEHLLSPFAGESRT